MNFTAPLFRFELTAKSKRIHLMAFAVTGVMLGVNSAYSQFALSSVPGLPGISAFATEQQFNIDVIINGAQYVNGVFGFSFAATPDASFSVVAATNLSFEVTNWTVVGAVSEVLPGKFRFTDPDATNHLQRVYRVRVAGVQ